MRQIIFDFGSLELFGFTFPLRLYGYGLMLVLGFLLGIFLAQWRARRTGENSEVIVHCSILALIGGIGGARVAYLIENRRLFAEGPLLEMLNVTSGGLIYFGGVLLATVLVVGYLRLKHLPIRRYLDIVAVSLMVGLAFGRAGCTLNGCCFGGGCRADWPLAMRFPMFSRPLVKLFGGDNPYSKGADTASPLYEYQLKRGEVRPDERLCSIVQKKRVHPPRYLHGALTSDQLTVMFGDEQAAEKLFNDLAGLDGLISADEWQKGLADGKGFLRGSEFWNEAVLFDRSRDGQLNFMEVWDYLQFRRELLAQRFDADRDGILAGKERAETNAYLQEDLIKLASRQWSAPVKPAQLLGLFNALILAVLLTAFYRLRRREGQVFALMVILYPITRFILESIRADNPHNLWKGVLTHNQYSSLAIVVAGVIMMFVLQRLDASAGPTWLQRVALADQARRASGTKANKRSTKK